MSEPTLYLFDGYNVLHAGEFGGDVRELKDILASFVAVRGARGIVVFDGVGRDETLGPLEVRYAENADALLERLASEHRDRERVCLVSSDLAVRGTAGQQVATAELPHFRARPRGSRALGIPSGAAGRSARSRGPRAARAFAPRRTLVRVRTN